ncbi:MAG: Wzz/FepE/Etk N-terminal domain-containing protein [Rhodoferax sp.]|nr:Wzz/FepE/Etk N-terminal domain-containing protein [Rhodoferax sp.]
MGKLLDTLIRDRWLVLGTACIVVFLAGIYINLMPRIYFSNMVLQIESSTGSLPGLTVLQSNSFLDAKPSINAEIEILRSRMVVEGVVDSLGLQINAEPRRFPLLGNWMARGKRRLSKPGLFGFKDFGGYTWAGEYIHVSQFSVPPEWQGKVFNLVAGENGEFTLLISDQDFPITGRVGQKIKTRIREKDIELQVDELKALPGARFEIRSLPRQRVIRHWQKALQVSEIGQIGRQSDVLSVALKGRDPIQITRILNEVGTRFVHQNVERRTEELARSLRFLEQQLPGILSDLNTAERKLSEYQTRHALVTINGDAKTLVQQMVLARTQVQQLKQKWAELSPQLTPVHPQLQVLQNQLQEAQASILELDRQLMTVPAIEQEAMRLLRDVKVNSELYVNLLNNMQQLRVLRAGKVSKVRLIDAAVTPESPIGPSPTLFVLNALAAGMVLGLGLSVFIDALRKGIEDPHDIEVELGLNVYAILPRSRLQNKLAAAVKRRTAGKHILASEDTYDPSIEALRNLQTTLLLMMDSQRPPIIMIAGPTPQVGKSFVSVNLAAVLAPLTKRRVLLIDLDLRRGLLHQYFGLDAENGFTDAVLGEQAIDTLIHREVLPGLDFLSRGQLIGNASDYLLHERCTRLLQQLGQQYEYVIMDTAPVLPVADVGLLAKHAAAIFLVAREGISTLPELHQTAQRLQQAGGRTTGVIFNDMSTHTRYGAYNSSASRYQRYQPKESPSKVT